MHISALVTTTVSPKKRSKVALPSTVRCKTFSLTHIFLISSLALSGKTSGLATSEWGHIGVTQKHESFGSTIGPPAESEYAVEPVGVAITIPSARYSLTSRPLSESSRSIILAVEPFAITASLRA